MNWYGSYSRRWRAYEVDPLTWDDVREIGNVESLDVSWDADSDSIQDGSMSVVGEQPHGFARIYLEADGDGERARVPVATMAADSRERAITGDTFSARVDLSSVLSEAAEFELPPGFFAPKGADPVRFALSLIEKHCPAPVESERSGLALERTIVAESGDTAITFARAVLEGTGRRVTVDGRGVVGISHSEGVRSLDGSRMYADGVTDKTEKGVRTVTYTRPYDPAIREGDTVSLFVPNHGIAGNFTVVTQRLNDDCEVQEEAAHAVT